MAEPLRDYLMDALPEQPIELDEHEMITDAVVLFRVVDASEAGLERYRYTTTSGMSFGMAVGIIEVTQRTLVDHYTRMLWDADEEDD